MVGLAGGIDHEVGDGLAAIENEDVKRAIAVGGREVPGPGSKGNELPVRTGHREEAGVRAGMAGMIVGEPRKLCGEPIVTENIVDRVVVLRAQGGGFTEEKNVTTVAGEEGHPTALVGLDAVVGDAHALEDARGPAVPEKNVHRIVGVTREEVVCARLKSNVAPVGA